MRIKLHVWRQEDRNDSGHMESHVLDNVSADMSFLEMLDTLNQQILEEGQRVIEFDHDCREGICGQCGVVINGRPHGPLRHTTTCQLHMRSFKDGDTIYVEPFRSASFPVICDLKIDRSAFDRIIEAGGYISASTGQAPEANSIPISHDVAEAAFDAAACIGCGACVATCTNSSAALFTSAKVMHMALLPQGQTEQYTRVKKMVEQMDEEGFGSCSNTGACEVECPQQISIAHIAGMNRSYLKAQFLE